mgnify:FL=1
MRILRRPMFKKGGSANEGIMHGLERRNYAQSNVADLFQSIAPERFAGESDIYTSMDPDSVDLLPGAYVPKGPSWIENWFKRQSPQYKHLKSYVTETDEVPEDATGSIPPGEIGGPGDISKVELPKKDNGDLDISTRTATEILADKRTALSNRAKEFYQLMSPHATKRMITDVMQAASVEAGESTGDWKQDLANIITAAGGASGKQRATYDDAMKLAIGESIQKGIAKATYKPNATESLIQLYRNTGMSDKDIAKTVSKSDSDNTLILAGMSKYPDDPNAAGKSSADLFNVKALTSDAKGYGGSLPIEYDKKTKSWIEDMTQMKPGKIYFNPLDLKFYKKIGKDDIKEVNKPDYLK